MIPLAWWALGVLFHHFAPASPAGNVAPLTRAIMALWRRLGRPVRSPAPQGPKGSVRGPGMPPPAASSDTIYKGVLVSHPSMGCQCCDSAGLTFIYSLIGPNTTGLVSVATQFNLTPTPLDCCFCGHLFLERISYNTGFMIYVCFISCHKIVYCAL